MADLASRAQPRGATSIAGREPLGQDVQSDSRWSPTNLSPPPPPGDLPRAPGVMLCSHTYPQAFPSIHIRGISSRSPPSTQSPWVFFIQARTSSLTSWKSPGTTSVSHLEGKFLTFPSFSLLECPLLHSFWYIPYSFGECGWGGGARRRGSGTARRLAVSDGARRPSPEHPPPHRDTSRP